MLHMPPLRMAVIVPCFNEAPTVADVVAGFRRVLPDAVCHVFDNHSFRLQGVFAAFCQVFCCARHGL